MFRYTKTVADALPRGYPLRLRQKDLDLEPSYAVTAQLFSEREYECKGRIITL